MDYWHGAGGIGELNSIYTYTATKRIWYIRISASVSCL